MAGSEFSQRPQAERFRAPFKGPTVELPRTPYDFRKSEGPQDKLTPNEVAYRIEHAEYFERLELISQLRYLLYFRPDGKPVDVDFSHNRKEHSMFVRAVATNILKEHGEPFGIDDDVLCFAEAGYLLHDIETPALGDGTKLLDGLTHTEELHEEKNWRRVLAHDQEINMVFDELQQLLETSSSCQAFGEFRRQDGSMKTAYEIVDDIIRNRGMLGRVLDIADKIYVAQDLQKPLSHLRREGGIQDDLVTFLKDNNDIGDIASKVALTEQGEVYFKNPIELWKLLYARKMLFQRVSLHPLNQATDYLTALMIEPFYSPHTDPRYPLNPDILCTITDPELLSALNEYHRLGYPNPEELAKAITRWSPTSYERFKRRSQAVTRKNELMEKGEPILGIHHSSGFSTGVHIKTVDSEGNIKPFKTVMTEEADELSYASGKSRGFYIFHTDRRTRSPIQKLAIQISERTRHPSF